MYFSPNNENNTGKANTNEGNGTTPGNVVRTQVHQQPNEGAMSAQQRSDADRTVAGDNHEAGGGSTPQHPGTGTGLKGNKT